MVTKTWLCQKGLHILSNHRSKMLGQFGDKYFKSRWSDKSRADA